MHVPPKEIRPRLVRQASAPVPTHFGEFEVIVYRDEGPILEGADPFLSHEPVAIVAGEVRGKEGVLVRVHSECITSEVFGSLKCDCKQQLEAAQEEIGRVGEGAIIYLRQEGRGIGLVNKLRAYALQAEGADTVDANRMLGLPDDARHYDAAVAMLEELGVRSVRLLTNNPAKVEALRQLGVDVVGRVPVIVQAPSAAAAEYLAVKRRRMHHMLPDSAGRIPGAPKTASGR